MKILKLFKYVYISVMSVIILVLVSFLLASLFSKKGYTEIFGYSFFEVQSYSMYPELDKGDLIVVKKRKSSEYKKDMVVTYWLPTDTIPTTHKIVSIENDTVITKGINPNTNNGNDLPFDIEYIIGEVVVVWSGYSNVKQFITNPVGIIIIILSGFLLIEGFNYIEDKYTKKEE